MFHFFEDYMAYVTNVSYCAGVCSFGLIVFGIFFIVPSVFLILKSDDGKDQTLYVIGIVCAVLSGLFLTTATILCIYACCVFSSWQRMDGKLSPSQHGVLHQVSYRNILRYNSSI